LPPGATSSNYDVTADGKRFLMINDDDQDSATSKQIVVVLGWSEELNRISSHPHGEAQATTHRYLGRLRIR